jgi:hypothetical protein
LNGLQSISDQTRRIEELQEELLVCRNRLIELEEINIKHNNLVRLLKRQKCDVKKPGMTNPRRNEVAYHQNWKCGICTEMLGPSFEIDHKIRWIDSFDDTFGNLQALCVICHKKRLQKKILVVNFYEFIPILMVILF